MFTLHCYPQEGSVGTDTADSATVLLRNQSTRQFWDTNYVDPSWINSVMMVIPRMKAWVSSNYPGTKIGITEYNWGAEADANGATAQADILGVFGREGLDLATRWTTPDASTPTYKAIKMYRNYDGNKSTFGNVSVQAVVPNPDNLAAFAAVRTNDASMTIMVINKDPSNITPVNLNVSNFPSSGTAAVWQLYTNAISRLADVAVTSGKISNNLPAGSVTLFVIPSTRPKLRIGRPDSTSQSTLWLDGVAGVPYVLQSSTNLPNWKYASTNTLVSNSLALPVSALSPSRQYFRAALLQR